MLGYYNYSVILTYGWKYKRKTGGSGQIAFQVV